MKRSKHYLPPILFIGLFLLSVPDANGQLLKKLGKAAERAAERTVERRVEKEQLKRDPLPLPKLHIAKKPFWDFFVFPRVR